MALWVALVFGFALETRAGKDPPKPPANEDCLACHADASATRASGTSVFVAEKAYAASTHGPMASDL